jgi:hypothetical protein
MNNITPVGEAVGIRYDYFYASTEALANMTLCVCVCTGIGINGRMTNFDAQTHKQSR